MGRSISERTEKMERLPTPDDNWSQVYDVIYEVINEWLGQTKMLAEPVHGDGDISLLPTSDETYNHETGEYQEPSKWSEEDKFWELMDGCTGNTIATYISGMGLRSEKIGDVLQDRVQNSIENLFLEINSIDDSKAIEFDFDPYSDDLREIAHDMLDGMENYTLKTVLSETKQCE